MIGLKSFQAQIILFLILTINEVIRAREKSFRKPKPNLSNFFMQLEDNSITYVLYSAGSEVACCYVSDDVHCRETLLESV